MQASRATPVEFDAYRPAQIVRRVELAGLAKIRQSTLTTLVLAILALGG